MGSATAKNMANEEAKVDMTPMIDITFLMLIFFMCNRFKSYENKLDSQLPTDEGLSASSVPTPVQQLRISIRLLSGSKDKVQLQPDPSDNNFKPIYWRDGDSGKDQMFKELRDQIRNGFRYIGDKIEVAPDAAVPFEYVALTIDAIHAAQKDKPDEGPEKKKKITFKAAGPQGQR